MTRPLLRLGIATLTASVLLSGPASAADAATGETSTSSADSRTGTTAPSDSDLDKTLQELEKSYQGRIGAVGIDLGTGKTVGYRADERFPLNSMFKVFACAAVLHKARTSDPGLMDKVVRWKPAD